MLGSMKVTTPAPPWIQPLLSVERCVEMAQLIKFQSVHSSLHALCCVGRHDDVLILLKLWFPFPPTKLEKAGRFRHQTWQVWLPPVFPSTAIPPRSTRRIQQKSVQARVPADLKITPLSIIQLFFLLMLHPFL